MTRVDLPRAVSLAGTLLVVAVVLDRLTGGNNMTLFHGVLMSSGLVLLAVSMAMQAGKGA